MASDSQFTLQIRRYTFGLEQNKPDSTRAYFGGLTLRDTTDSDQRLVDVQNNQWNCEKKLISRDYFGPLIVYSLDLCEFEIDRQGKNRLRIGQKSPFAKKNAQWLNFNQLQENILS